MDGQSSKQWWNGEGIVFAGNWEPLMFRRRRGSASTNEMERYDHEHSEETVQDLANAGVNLVITHFHKGFGLSIEQDEIEEAKKLADSCHDYGIKIGYYIRPDTLIGETFFEAYPEASEWLQVNQYGEHPTYGNHQTFRYQPCINNESYMDYLEDVVKFAVDEMDADLIHFDDMHWSQEPDSCRCESCLNKFEDYLVDKYPDDNSRIERFGHTLIERIEPPRYNRFNQPWNLETIDDPAMQEWIQFRCESLADVYERLCKVIKDENPNCAVDCNAIARGIGSINQPYYSGVWPPEGIKHGDFIWTESSNWAGMSDDDVLRSKIRTYKAAQSFDNTVFTYVDGALAEGDSQLLMAEAMAYNPGCIGMIGSPNGAFATDEQPLTEMVQPKTLEYVDFYREHQEYFCGREPVTDVAVIRSYPSMAYNNYSTYLSTLLVEQTMIESHIPFTIDYGIDAAEDYSAIILPNTESLSDEDLNLLREYVEDGGGLVATDKAGQFDNHRRRRPIPGIIDIFNMGDEFPDEPITLSQGDGKITYIPEVRPKETPPQYKSGQNSNPEYNFIDNKYWRLPKNWEEIVDAIKSVVGELSITIDGPESVTAELAVKDNSLFVNLVNYRSPESVEDLQIHLNHPKVADSKKAQLLSPDQQGKVSYDINSNGNETSLTIPELNTYVLLIVE